MAFVITSHEARSVFWGLKIGPHGKRSSSSLIAKMQEVQRWKKLPTMLSPRNFPKNLTNWRRRCTRQWNEVWREIRATIRLRTLMKWPITRGHIVCSGGVP